MSFSIMADKDKTPAPFIDIFTIQGDILHNANVSSVLKEISKFMKKLLKDVF